MTECTMDIEILLQGRRCKKMIDRIYKELRSVYDLKQVDVDVLLYMVTSPGRPSSGIAQDLGLNKAHVSMAMDHLIRSGYLSCEKDPADRRFLRYEITPSGQTVSGEILARKDQLNELLFRDFSEQDMRDMERLCRKLLDNLEKIPD